MSVSNGQDANETTFNNAFVSKTSNDTKTGTLTMSDTTQSSDKDTGALVLQGGLGVEKNINAGGTISGSNLSNTNTGDVTFETIGSTPADEGASVSGQAITLQPADATHGGVVSTTTQSFAGNKTFTGDVTITGDLTVNGSNTVVNTETLDVEDVNITVNKGGNNTTAQGAGITIERTGTDGSIIYDSTVTSRFKIGDLGSETEVLTAGDNQSIGSTKTFLDPIQLQEKGSTPSTPSTGLQKLYPKTDGKFYHLDDTGTETELGAGTGTGGSGGVNFFENENFSTNTDNVTAYNDGGAYVDGTGGSSGLSADIIDSSVSLQIDGDGTLRISKSNGDQSGSGITFTTRTVGRYYRDSILYGSFKYRVLDVNYPADDLKIYAYDVTNAAELSVEPYADDDLLIDNISLGEKKFKIYGTTSSTTTIRISLHLETDNASGTTWTMSIDELKIGPAAPIFGFNGSDFSDDLSSSFTFNNFGTVSAQSIFGRYIGDSYEARGYMTAGSSTASTASVTIPFTLDSAKFVSATNRQIVGYYTRGTSSEFLNANNAQGFIFYDGSTTNQLFFAGAGSSNVLAKLNANSLVGSGENLMFYFTVPVSGRSSNITLSNSSSFKMGPISASGTRVTSTPTSQNEYRTLIKDSSAATFSDTDGSGKVSAANGFRIYSVGGTSAGTSTEPNRYIHYIGKNKSYKIDWFSSSGKTGRISTDWGFYPSASVEKGLLTSYDPTSGLLIVTMPISGSSTTDRYVGTVISSDTAAQSSATDCYYEITVYEDALPVGLVVPQSEVVLVSGNGFGSTATNIRRFSTTMVNTGTAITYSDSSTAGGLFTINENGIYSITYNDRSNAGENIGITLNASSLTVAPGSLPYTELVGYVDIQVSSNTSTLSHTLRLSKGDLIRAQGTKFGTYLDSNTSSCRFRIIKVSD